MSTQQTQPRARTEGTWHGRPVLSFLVRTAVYAVPLAVGLVAAQIVAAAVEGHTGRWSAVALTLATGVGTSWLVTRITTRFLPLAVLLRMTMLFPDRAPTRLAVARRTTSTSELTQRLATGEADEREAATTLLALVTSLSRHDRKTRGHSERVRLFCDLLGEQLGLDEGERGRLRWAALVHDIGKLEVASRILNKPAKLDADEWLSIKAHPAAGARLAQPLAEWLGPWFAGIAEHHERYDGTGYPLGLKGAEISLSGRAVAVVDAFETMTAARSYKSPVSTWSARAELTRCAGSQFDPMMVRAFLQIALPSVLRAVGPLAFIVNVPFLRWVGQSTVRAADVASGTVANTVAAAGVSAVVVAGSGVPSPDIQPYAAGRQGTPAATAEVGAGGTGISGPGGDLTSADPQGAEPGAAVREVAGATSLPPADAQSSPEDEDARPAPTADPTSTDESVGASASADGSGKGTRTRPTHPARPTQAATPTPPPQAKGSAKPTQAATPAANGSGKSPSAAAPAAGATPAPPAAGQEAFTAENPGQGSGAQGNSGQGSSGQPG